MPEQISGEKLFEEFKTVQLSEFFRKNRQYLGYVGKIKSLTTVIHELLSNSLDACEEAKISPSIKITISELGTEHYKVRVEDNGPGIPEQHLEKVFGQLLTGTKFHRNIQLRGQQGLGVSGCVLFSQMTTGKSTYIKSGTGKGKIVEARVEIDIKTNSPNLIDKKVENSIMRGTVVEAEFKGVQYTKGIRGPFEYIRWTAAANPHAEIMFKDPEGSEMLFERVIDKVPKVPKEVKPHPSGLEAHDILDLALKSKSRAISSFLSSDLARVSSDKVSEIQALVDFDLAKSPKRLEWPEAEQIVKSFKKIKFMAPPTDGLIPIGKDQIEKALNNLLSPDFIEVISRKPTTYKGGIPFIVEIAIAYGGNSGRAAASKEINERKVEIMRFANRSPLLFDAGGCALTKAVNSIDWRRYKLKDMENSPVSLFINLISTHVPYTSAGKQAVAGEEEILNEIRMALMRASRSLQLFLSGRRKASEIAERKKMYERYIPETAKALAKLTGKKEDEIEEMLKALVLERFGDDKPDDDEEEEELEEESAAYDEIPEDVSEEDE
ncbi:TPA: DNA topoisomerase VI subunit B [archaeon]|jgi:DNA topoisomerase-6 subunit B|uniref:Type 2 DNA topoisomerase 6 subunit B n=1 Tax=Candidatus Undinarchaeum marinum TaxID=2756141 RepID=A0A832XHS9_9ARCH|nr:DNA topoisomerase VI subunit B [Candidatus Undinarchaeum marinum]